MKKEEKIMLAGVFVLACIIMEMMIFGGFGIGVVIGVAGYFSCFMIIAKYYKKQASRASQLLLIPIILCTLCFVLFSNDVLKILNTLFLMGLLLIHSIEFWGVEDLKLFQTGWSMEVVKLGFKLPFCHFNKPAVLIKDEMNLKENEHFKTVKKILLGILLALPMLLVVLCLLESADAAFAGVLDVILRNIHFEIGPILKRVIVVVLLFGVLFSYFYGLVTPKEKQEVKQGLSVHLDFIIIATIGTMLCLVYVAFYLSQLAYFISAFQGVLPEGFTFAEYARRGFFENLPLTMINLGGILILGSVIKGEEGRKKAYIKCISGFIAVFTLFMSLCACSKMWLYIQTYGLTLLRVYVSWFLILSSLIVILLFINNIWHKLPVVKGTFIIFTVMYLGLNYSNVDYLVAQQNAALYEKNEVESLSAYYNLSSSAMGPISDLAQKNEAVLQDDAVKYMIEKVQHTQQYEKWQSWNVADAIAVKQAESVAGKVMASEE